MISAQKAFRYAAVSAVITAILITSLVIYNREPPDPVTQCIQDQLLKSQELKRLGLDEREAGREDAGDRLIREGVRLEMSVTNCLDLDESGDNPGQ